MSLSVAAAAEAATIEAECREDGAEIPVADYATASTAWDAGATLVTADPISIAFVAATWSVTPRSTDAVRQGPTGNPIGPTRNRSTRA